ACVVACCTADSAGCCQRVESIAYAACLLQDRLGACRLLLRPAPHDVGTALVNHLRRFKPAQECSKRPECVVSTFPACIRRIREVQPQPSAGEYVRACNWTVRRNHPASVQNTMRPKAPPAAENP